MARFAQHELMELQEHIRSSAATAHVCRQMAQMAQDPDVKNFCIQESRSAESTAQKLMSLMQNQPTH